MPEDKPNEEGRLISPAAPDDQPPERTGRSWPWVVIVLVVVLGIGLLVYLRLRTPPVIPHPPAPVEIAMTKVEKGAIPVYVNWALGTVTPLATVTVLSRVDGQIMKVNYTEGQIVPAGFVLLQIDSRPFDAQLATAQGQLQHDREVLAETKINQKRYEEAYAQKAIPKQQLDDQASLVRQLEGTVKLDEGQVAAAQTQVDYCTISAPVAGLVGLRLVDVGNIVHAAGTTGLVVSRSFSRSPSFSASPRIVCLRSRSSCGRDMCCRSRRGPATRRTSLRWERSWRWTARLTPPPARSG